MLAEAFPIGLLLLGFVALYFGAEWLVTGAAELADHLKISKVVIGLTLVALGTSAPEMFVNVIAGFYGHTELALSNVVGSNLTNICLGFGLAAMLVPLPLSRREYAPDLFFAALGPVLVVVSFLWTANHELSIWAVLPMLVLAGIYLFSLLRRRSALETQTPSHPTMFQPAGLVVLGTIALFVGGHMVFVNATALAAAWQLPEQIIGLTVVACGTSIPDVTASVVAARRREFGICIGNLLGSNISNVFLVLPGTVLAAGQSLAAERIQLLDYAVVAALSILFALWCGTWQQVTRAVGLVLIGVFAAFYVLRILWM